MNYKKPNDILLSYQTRRLQELTQEIVDCCQERTDYLSKRFDIPQAEVRCLMLFAGEKYLTPKRLSQKLDVAKSRVTRLVEGLTQKGLVESIQDVKDGRIKLISLTEKGKRVFQEIDEISRDLHQKVILELEPEQRKMALSYLEVLRSSMEAVKAELV
jgi:DNA-binding MarR family transcriptional regulator